MNSGAQTQSQIRDQLNTSPKIIEDINRVVDGLGDRLTTVLRAQHDHKKPQSEKTKEELVPLATDIQKINDSMFAIYSKLESMLSRLEL